MLDIRLIRENSDFIKERIKTRGGEDYLLVDTLLACDKKRRALETENQQLLSQRRQKSKEIGQLKGKGEETTAKEEEVRVLGDRIEALSKQLETLNKEQRDLLLKIPNLPHEGCPEGKNETANPILREWGEQPSFEFEPKDHVVLGTQHGMLDFENAAKISGSGFVVYRGAGARLQRALINFLLDLHVKEHGYLEISPPVLVKRECMEGTGQLPKFDLDNAYALKEDDFFLIPTAEVPITNLERENLLYLEDLPKKYTAYTPCFRREGSSAGRESRGMIRMHQFDKVELVKIVHPEESYAALETLTTEVEKALQLLGLHYRIIELCQGDLGFSAAKTYDIEVWAPAHGSYLEASSCSNFVDYQARRMNLRFKDPSGKNRFPHTLNGSGPALSRLPIALMETYQQADGSIHIPEALQPYFGAAEINMRA